MAAEARSAQTRGDYLRAAEAYSKMIEAGSDGAEIRSNLGLLLHLSGRDAEALKQFLRAIELNPKLPSGHLFAGICLLRLGRPSQALPYLLRADKMEPTGVAPTLALGKAYLALHDFPRAASAFTEATIRDPRNGEAWYGLGATYRSEADGILRRAYSGETADTQRAKALLARALETLSRAIELDPTSVHSALILAESLRDSGKLTEAIGEYQKLLRNHPDMAAVYLGLGTTFWRNGMLDEAEPLLNHVLSTEPNDPDANWLIADILIHRGDYTRAELHASKALAGNPALLEAHGILGKAYLGEGKPEAAVAELQKALRIDHDGRYYYQMYRALRDLGRDAEAAMALEKYKQLRASSRRRSPGIQ